MKIIVTGCKGQLGTEIIKQLREGRSEIGPIPEKLMNATVIPVDLPELDISNYKMVDDFIRRQRPDVIINCAAYTNVDGCEVNHDAAFKANALGPAIWHRPLKRPVPAWCMSPRTMCSPAVRTAALHRTRPPSPAPSAPTAPPSSWAKVCGAVLPPPLHRPHGMAVQLLRQELRQDHRQRWPEIRQAGGGQRPVRQPHQRG